MSFLIMVIIFCFLLGMMDLYVSGMGIDILHFVE